MRGTDDVADAEIFRRDVHVQRGIRILAGAGGRVADFRPEQIEHPRQRFPQRADAEAAEDQRGEFSAALTRHEHLGARSAFGIGQDAVLLDDQGPAERHHHQHAENAAGKGQHRDLEVVEIRRPERFQEEQRRNREHDAAGDRFARRSDRLDDVVLENGRTTEALEHRDRQHGDRDRCADCQPRAQSQVDGGCAEQKSEERADHDGLQREFGRRFSRRDVRFDGVGRGRRGLLFVHGGDISTRPSGALCYNRQGL